jgi:GTP pyrophosphokinase
MTLSVHFEEALVFATRLHAGQRRKGTSVPYIAHLLAVAGIVLDYGGTESEVIAALLHDAVEDQGGPPTREEIRRRFGEPVVAIVDGCSDTDEVPKPPWQERKEAYLARLGQETASVRLVSAADKLHNARDVLAAYRALGEAVWGRFTGGREGTLWYYRALVGAYRDTHTVPALVDELDRVVTEIERLAARG